METWVLDTYGFFGVLGVIGIFLMAWLFDPHVDWQAYQQQTLQDKKKDVVPMLELNNNIRFLHSRSERLQAIHDGLTIFNLIYLKQGHVEYSIDVGIAAFMVPDTMDEYGEVAVERPRPGVLRYSPAADEIVQYLQQQGQLNDWGDLVVYRTAEEQVQSRRAQLKATA